MSRLLIPLYYIFSVVLIFSVDSPDTRELRSSCIAEAVTDGVASCSITIFLCIPSPAHIRFPAPSRHCRLLFYLRSSSVGQFSSIWPGLALTSRCARLPVTSGSATNQSSAHPLIDSVFTTSSLCVCCEPFTFSAAQIVCPGPLRPISAPAWADCSIQAPRPWTSPSHRFQTDLSNSPTVHCKRLPSKFA
jgi:hypothetical protein